MVPISMPVMSAPTRVVTVGGVTKILSPTDRAVYAVESKVKVKHFKVESTTTEVIARVVAKLAPVLADHVNAARAAA